MATYRYVVYDVLETFKQTLDDSTIQPSQVFFWVNVVANRLAKLHADKHDTGLYETVFSNVSVNVDSSLHDRKYIELPAKIFDLDNEKSVRYITYNLDSLDCCEGPAFSQVFFQRTTSRKSHRLYMNPYEKPSSKNPYFYRVGDKLYFLGTECINLTSVEVSLFTSFETTISSDCDLDTEIALPDDLIQILIFEVRNLGRLSLLVPKENVNEGEDKINQELRRRGLTVPQQEPVVPPQEGETQ